MMRLRNRTATGLVLVTVLVLAAGLAGCIGDTGEGAAAETNNEDESLATANATDEGNQTATEDAEPTVEEQTTSLEGSGTGVGVEPTEGMCVTCVWIVGDGVYEELSVPDNYEDGTIEFAWEGGQSLGGMWLWIRDANQETVHAFRVGESPAEIDLNANDARLQAAAEVVVLPADTPVAAHVDVSWSGEFSFLVPQDGGEDPSGPYS